MRKLAKIPQFAVIWSLMPKGVEHWLPKPWLRCLSCDLIFDAERRWARFWPGGVSKSHPWFDLWCRKALSTIIIRLMLRNVCLWFDLWCRKALSTRQAAKRFNIVRWSWFDLWCRKALSTPGIARCSGFARTWFDLWCRKALSTVKLLKWQKYYE